MRSRLGPLLLFATLLVIYHANLRSIGSGDTESARVLPLAILQERTLTLDRFVEAWAGKVWSARPYFLWRSQGHVFSVYPVTTPLLATPFYLPLAISLASWARPLTDPWLIRQLELTSKFAAASLAALSAVFLFLLLRRHLRLGSALFAVLIYALGSNVWQTSSQALWQHGTSQLLIVLTLWLLERERLLGAGLAAALAVSNRPPNLIFLALVALYVARTWGRRGWPFLVFPPLILALFMAYNLQVFGQLAGPRHTVAGDFSFRGFPAGLIGLLLGPSRGLIIYSPWILASCWGGARVWRSADYPALWRYLTLVIGGELMLYSTWVKWWGGGSFGPRLISDLLPVFALLLVPYLRERPGGRGGQVALLLAGLYAVAVQFVGVFYWWPPETDQWSWRDCQLAQALRVRAGMPPCEWLGTPARPRALSDFSQELRLEAPFARLRQAETACVQIRARNTGREIWPWGGIYGVAHGDRQVRLSYHWLDGGGRIVAEGYHTALPADLYPGEERSLRAELLPPEPPGPYRLRFSMLQENVAWFDDKGAQPLEVPVTVTPAGTLDEVKVSGLPSPRYDRDLPFSWFEGPQCKLTLEAPRAGRAQLTLVASSLATARILEVEVLLNDRLAGVLGVQSWWAARPLELPVPLHPGPNTLTLRWVGLDRDPGSLDPVGMGVAGLRLEYLRP